MSDTFAPSMNKVGVHEPPAPLSHNAAPTVNNAPFLAVCPPGPSAVDHKPDDKLPSIEKPIPEMKSAFAALGGAGPAHVAPKPVEIMSVPQTPINGTTPAGGTPRPELPIPLEPIQEKKPLAEPPMMIKAHEPALDKKPLAPEHKPLAQEKKPLAEPAVMAAIPVSQPAPVASIPAKDPITDGPNGAGASKPAEMTGAIQDAQPARSKESSESVTGEKRKLDDAAPPSTSLSMLPHGDPVADAPPADKKVKMNGGPGPKVGRPKKEKKAAPAVGRTARKTRSQGPVET